MLATREQGRGFETHQNHFLGFFFQNETQCNVLKCGKNSILRDNALLFASKAKINFFRNFLSGGFPLTGPEVKKKFHKMLILV